MRFPDARCLQALQSGPAGRPEGDTAAAPRDVSPHPAAIGSLDRPLDVPAIGSPRPSANQLPEVYELEHADHDGGERLYIGKAGDLRLRVRQGLVKGKLPHSGGRRIRELEDISRLALRWAKTQRPAAAEEELHRAYRARFGALPAYTGNT